MALSLVTSPDDEPVTVEDAKIHVKVDTDDEDALIASLVQAAREYCEVFTGRKCLRQTWDLKLDDFPCNGFAMELPFPPVSSVTSVSYVDADGVTQTWAAGATGYTTDLPVGPQASHARVFPSYGVWYPATRSQPNAVTVRFVCGYGTDAATVPAGFVAAIKLLLGHWYLNRESVVIGTVSTSVQTTVDALLWPYRVF